MVAGDGWCGGGGEFWCRTTEYKWRGRQKVEESRCRCAQWSWPCLDGSASGDDGRGSLPAVLLSSLARQASLGSPVVSQAVKLSKPGGSVAGGGWRPCTWLDLARDGKCGWGRGLCRYAHGS